MAEYRYGMRSVAAHKSHLLSTGQRLPVAFLFGAGRYLRPNISERHAGHWFGVFLHLGMAHIVRLRHVRLERTVHHHQRRAWYRTRLLAQARALRQTG